MSAYEFIGVGEPTGQADQSALVLHDLVSSLLSEHRHQKHLIEKVGGLMAGIGHDEVLRYFLAGADQISCASPWIHPWGLADGKCT